MSIEELLKPIEFIINIADNLKEVTFNNPLIIRETDTLLEEYSKIIQEAKDNIEIIKNGK